MIGNGFIKDVDGDWFSVVGLDRVIVTQMPKEYADVGNYWQIEAIWIVDRKDCSVTIDKYFESLEEAQLRLDSIMGDGL